MFRFALFATTALSLGACSVPAIKSQQFAADQPEISCLTQPGCNFNQSPVPVSQNQPVRIAPRPFPFFPTSEPLVFVDAKGTTWTAPIKTLTDGASIPPIFVAIVGAPRSPEFINAAAVHDAYCGIGNEAAANFQAAYWEDVHIMFYDALIAGGTKPLTAKLMFAAVWLGGPRWPLSGSGNAVVSSQGTEPAFDRDRSLTHVPVSELQAALKRTKSFIAREDPSLPHLLAYLRAEERRLVAALAREDHEVELNDDGGEVPVRGDEGTPGDDPVTDDGGATDGDDGIFTAGDGGTGVITASGDTGSAGDLLVLDGGQDGGDDGTVPK